jgi:O-antigen/teichoic acid export membrane protein
VNIDAICGRRAGRKLTVQRQKMITRVLRRLADRVRSGPKSGALFFYSGSSLVCQFLRFIGIVVSTSRIQADQFGILASAAMVCALASFLSGFGQNSALLSSPGIQPGYARVHLFITGCVNTIGMLLTVGAVLLIPSLHDLRSLWPLLLFQIVFETITLTPMIVAQKSFAFKGLALVEISAVTTWLLITIFAAWRCPVVYALVAAKLGETAVRGTLLFAWQFPLLWDGRATPTIFRYYFGFAKLLAPEAWIETFGGNLDVLLLRVFTNNVEIGIFDRTMHLLRIPLALSVNLIDAVAGASYSREQESPEVVDRTLRKFSLVVLVGTFFGVAVVQIFLWFFAGPTLGAAWKQSIESVWLWAIPIAIVRPFFWNFNIFFRSTGRPKELLLTLSLATCLLLVLGSIATPMLGIRGLFLASAAANFIPLFFQIRWARRRQESPPEFLPAQQPVAQERLK